MPSHYRITGTDGQLYGPVTLESVERWIKEGRIVPATLIRRDDGEPAQACGFPEIDAIFQARASRPTPAGPHAPPASPAPARAAPGEFRVWDFMGQAWTLVKPNWLPLAAMFFILSALSVFPTIGGLVWFIIGGPIMVGIWRALLALVAGRPPTVGMMFEGFDRFGDAFLAALVMQILVALGFIAMIVPGIILLVLWSFTYPILGETRLSFYEAMRQSAVLTEGYRWRLFLLGLACIPILLLGLLALCVGIYLALPVCYTAFALAYRWLQQHGRPPARPA